MSKEYIPKQFTPFIYPEWGELFDELTDNQNAEILKAITKYPDYEPKNIPVWKFIKSQLQKDYENFKAKCKKRGEASRTYWGNKGEQMISNDIKSSPKDIKGEPKPLTINHLPLTTNSLTIYEEEESKQVIEYLNNKTNYNYKFVDKNIKLVSNRLKEYSKEELLAMIDYKCSEWLQDERFKKYLRPATLFNASKCADYIAQLQTNGLKNNLRSKIRGNL